MAKMTPHQIEAMNRRRYGKTGKKPTQAELDAAFERQKPKPSDKFQSTIDPENL
jgi:hypothetical protein